MQISSSLKKTQAQLEATFSNCFDVTLRPLTDTRGRKILVLFVDGLVKKETIQEEIIRPLLGFAIDADDLRIKNLEELRRRLLTPVTIQPEPDYDAAVTHILSGDTLVFLDGCTSALCVQTRGWMSRSISAPDTQRAVRGPKEGFTETLLFNTAMLRRKIRSPRLKTEIMQLGDISRTDVCLTYLEGVTAPALVDELRRRLKAIRVDYILESGHIEQLIEDRHATLFSTTGNNEKPDVVAAKLLKGRAAILVDGTPFVLTLPMLFTESFQTSEDYYTRPFYANFLRLLRVAAYIVSITLPALYVALLTFHQGMIPDKLLNTLITASAGVPFSVVLEMFLMLLLYELLREALLRLPTPVGASVGIVGVLVIGDAAVAVNLLGGPTIVVAALTFLTSAVVNSTVDSSTLLRFALLTLGALFGAYGVFVGLFLLLTHLCTLTSYGYPFLLPLSPVRPRGLKDSIVRGGTKGILRRGGN